MCRLCSTLVLAASLLAHLLFSHSTAVNAQQTESPFAEPRRLLEQGKFSEAIAALEKLREQKPELAGVSRGLGTAYYRQGDYMKAITKLQQAVQKNANDGESTPTNGVGM